MFLNRPENTRVPNVNPQNVPLNYTNILEQNRIQHPGNRFQQQSVVPVQNFPVPFQAPVQQMPRQVQPQNTKQIQAVRQHQNNYEDDDTDSVYSRTSYATSHNSTYDSSLVPDSASQVEEGGDLRNVLKEWLTLDSKIKEASTALRKLRRRKESLQDEIIKFMEENGLDELKTPNDDISLKEQTSNRYVTSRTLVSMLSQLAVEKNIPALRNFLSTTPLQFSKSKTKVMRDEHAKDDALNL